MISTPSSTIVANLTKTPNSTNIGFSEDDKDFFKADFINNTYKQNGIAKTFSDLFSFTRAGKAWLVKDTGLQEFAIDVPRFDGGLLIEQSATNLLTDSALETVDAFTTRGGNYTTTSDSILKVGRVYTLVSIPMRGYLYKNLITPSTDYQVSVYVSKDNGSIDIKIGEGTATVDANPIGFTDLTHVVMTNQIVKIYGRLTSPSAANRGLVRYDTTRSGNIRIHAMQIEQGGIDSSLIVTTTSPVTRPADFLTSRILGTTVTGDWDSTLTLSIVNGQLVHSGYGKIRTLEIN